MEREPLPSMLPEAVWEVGPCRTHADSPRRNWRDAGGEMNIIQCEPSDLLPFVVQSRCLLIARMWSPVQPEKLRSPQAIAGSRVTERGLVCRGVGALHMFEYVRRQVFGEVAGQRHLDWERNGSLWGRLQ